MAAAVGVLGPVVVSAADGDRSPGGRVPRALLARLVIGPGVVSVDELAEAAWGSSPPVTMRESLNSHISRLRSALRAALDYDAVSSHPGGYRLTLPVDDVDAWRFERSIASADGLPAEVAGSLLRDALALWRGPAFGDLRYEAFACAEAARLEELRLFALEERLEADLRCGEHKQLVSELTALVNQEPLRERLSLLAMRALLADGRQRDAIREYDRYRAALVEASGLDPGPAITALRDGILLGTDGPAGDGRPAIRYARTSSGAHVGYVQRSCGPPWLLALGCDAHLSAAHLDDEPGMAAVERRLAGLAGLLRMDRPGIGLSDAPVHGGAPTLDEWGDAALAVADRAGATRFVVFGTGWSVPPALALAARRPDRVAALVLVNGFARFVRADDHPFGIPPRIVAMFRDAVLDTTQETMPTELDDVLLHAPSRAGDARFRAWWRRSGQQSATPATSDAHFALLFDVDVRHLLGDVRQPALVLQRRENRYVRVAHGRHLAEHLPAATYVELPGADQLLAAGSADDALDAIAEFLRAISASAGP